MPVALDALVAALACGMDMATTASVATAVAVATGFMR
jgi:hypothetical protein